MSAYVARPGDAARDRDVVIDVWRGNLGQEERLAAKYEWFYRGCPWGAPLLQLLRHEPSSSWVGVAGAGPRRMVSRGREIGAGVLVDLAVTADHRSLGPALTLQKALLTASSERFDLLYGFPNTKAAAVFARAGYSRIGELVRYARVLRHRGYLERRMPEIAARPLGWALDLAVRARAAIAARRDRALTAEWHHAVDPRMDELWERSDHGRAVIAPRDTTMLRWRFDRAPLPHIRYLMLSDTKSGRLEAWFACQSDGATLHVRDFWSVDAARAVGRPFVDALLRAARRGGYSNVSVEYAGPASRRLGWLEAGFIPRSRRPIFGRWRDPSLRDEPVHLTSADEDE